jgi:hypothetical protein
VSLVERARVIRDLDEERLRTSLVALLRPTASAQRAAAGISALGTPLRGKRPRMRPRRAQASASTPSPMSATPDAPSAPIEDPELTAASEAGPKG